MNFKNWKKSVNSEEKTHFKMYKSGKIWKVAGITLVGFGLFGGATTVVNNQLSSVVYAAPVGTYEDAISDAIQIGGTIEARKVAAAEQLPLEKVKYDDMLKKIEDATTLDDASKALAKAELQSYYDDVVKKLTVTDTEVLINFTGRPVVKPTITVTEIKSKVPLAFDVILRKITSGLANPLAMAKAVANHKIDNILAEETAKIDANPDLTDTEKKDQKAKATAAAAVVYSQITKSTTEDDVTKAVTNEETNETIANANNPAPSLDDLKTAEKAKIKAALDTALAAIDADTGLTSTEKQATIDKVTSDAGILTGEVTDVTNPTEVAAVDPKIPSITYTPGSSLDDDKKAALADIETKRTAALTAIDQDSGLTTPEIKDAQDKINGDADALVTKFNSATPDELAAINPTEIDKITYTPGPSLDDKKTVAKSSVDLFVKATTKVIENDDSLSQNEKENQIKNLKSSTETILKAIDDAQNADAVNDTLTDIPKITANHVKGSPVSDQKTKQTEVIDKLLKDTIDAINQDPTLTTSEKIKQVGDALSATKKVNDAINDPSVTTADQINDIIKAETEKPTIVPTHVEGTPVATTKDDAKKAIDQVQKDTIQGINDDPTLTTAEKIKQVGEALSATKKAKDAIDDPAVDTAQKVKELLDDETTTVTPTPKTATIKSTHTAGPTVDELKDTADKTLDTVEKKTIAAINGDDTLTPTEKAKQIEDTKLANAKVKTALADPTVKTADQIKAILDRETSTANPAPTDQVIAPSHKPGASVADQKKKALEDITKTAETAKNDIDKDATKTQAEKDADKAAVDKKSAELTDTVNKSKTATEIEKPATETPTLPDLHKPGTPLDKQKADKIGAINDKLSDVISAITNDPTISEADKTDQITKAQNIANTLINQVNDSKNADEIKAINPDYVDTHVSGESLDSKKDKIKDQVQAALDETKDAINADTTLTEEEKADQIATAEETATAILNDLDAATTLEQVNQAETAVPTIYDSHVEGDLKDTANESTPGTTNTSLPGNQVATNSALPQTSEKNQSIMSLVGLGLLSGLALFGLAYRKRKD